MKPAAFRGTRRRPPKSGFPAWPILILLAAFAAFPPAGRSSVLPPAQSASYEYDVKAVFLYHFTRYLAWPEDIESEAFTIVVLGASDIIAPLQEIARKRTVGRMPIEVRQCFEVERIGRPRILFIAKSAAADLARAVEETRGTDILTVGEMEGLCARGVAVNFIQKDGTIKFEMSPKALKEARIQTSSQLLKLAVLVDGKEERGDR